jgi:hypothetical protein
MLGVKFLWSHTIGKADVNCNSILTSMGLRTGPGVAIVCCCRVALAVILIQCFSVTCRREGVTSSEQIV